MSAAGGSGANPCLIPQRPDHYAGPPAHTTPVLFAKLSALLGVISDSDSMV